MMNRDIDKLELSLTDDGTLDTVFTCWCKQCGDEWEERFCSEAIERDENLWPTNESMEWAQEQCEEAHAELSPKCYA